MTVVPVGSVNGGEDQTQRGFRIWTGEGLVNGQRWVAREVLQEVMRRRVSTIGSRPAAADLPT
jgi:hypothetical protein